mmetsp:Transcript_23193/g.65844  ORF Transcript_23193/g.65844 Transcript_23193/m.65844 type:complete len:241 (-) Transcript_23193:67-789(-)
MRLPRSRNRGSLEGVVRAQPAPPLTSQASAPALVVGALPLAQLQVSGLASASRWWAKGSQDWRWSAHSRGVARLRFVQVAWPDGRLAQCLQPGLWAGDGRGCVSAWSGCARCPRGPEMCQWWLGEHAPRTGLDQRAERPARQSVRSSGYSVKAVLRWHRRPRPATQRRGHRGRSRCRKRELGSCGADNDFGPGKQTLEVYLRDLLRPSAKAPFREDDKTCTSRQVLRTAALAFPALRPSA